MPGASSWSFREEDFKIISEQMNALLRETNVKSLLLVDRAGQVVANVGDAPTFDPQAFASLTAADFSANDQLAKMLGEHEFSSLFHQGEKESMYLADVAHRVILVVLFDNRTTLGMVQLQMKGGRELTRCSTACSPGRRRRRQGGTGFWAKPRTKSTSSSD